MDNDKPTPHKHDELWTQAQRSLRLQLARTTYDTWLAQATVAPSDDRDTLRIVIQGTDLWWMRDRLMPTVQRAVNHAADRPMNLELTSSSTMPQQATAHVRVHDFDPTTRGYQILPAYATKFWLPFLGATPFTVWLLLKTWYYTNSSWTRQRPLYLRLIAQTIGCHTQSLTGRQGKPGALQILATEGVARLHITGSTRDRRYHVKVRNNLPLLRPAQVATLPALIQHEHSTFLALADIDATQWQQTPIPFDANAPNDVISSGM